MPSSGVREDRALIYTHKKYFKKTNKNPKNRGWHQPDAPLKSLKEITDNMGSEADYLTPGALDDSHCNQSPKPRPHWNQKLHKGPRIPMCSKLKSLYQAT